MLAIRLRAERLALSRPVGSKRTFALQGSVGSVSCPKPIRARPIRFARLERATLCDVLPPIPIGDTSPVEAGIPGNH